VGIYTHENKFYSDISFSPDVRWFVIIAANNELAL
jgi:hypothetical protein